MEQITIEITIDETIKQQFEEICQAYGMDVSTACTLFLKAVVRDKQILLDLLAKENNHRAQSG
jgi:DNA-damage-inducible protein J